LLKTINSSVWTIPTFIFLLVVIHISNFRVVPRGIPRRTRLTQRLVHAANTIAFPLEHERYIACVLHAAPLSANTDVVSVPKIGEFSRVYTSHQSDVIMNWACATFAEFRRWFGFVCWKQKNIACKLNTEVVFIGIYLFSTATRFVYLGSSTQIKQAIAGYGQT